MKFGSDWLRAEVFFQVATFQQTGNQNFQLDSSVHSVVVRKTKLFHFKRLHDVPAEAAVTH